MTMNCENDIKRRFPTADRAMASWLAESQDNARRRKISRRRFMGRAAVAAGLVGLVETVRRVEAESASRAAVSSQKSIKITKVEPFMLKNSWSFVKISTNVGIIG